MRRKRLLTIWLLALTLGVLVIVTALNAASGHDSNSALLFAALLVDLLWVPLMWNRISEPGNPPPLPAPFLSLLPCRAPPVRNR